MSGSPTSRASTSPCTSILARRRGRSHRSLDRSSGIAMKTLLACLLLVGGTAMAADIKLIGSPGARGVVMELASAFERQTGHKVIGDFVVIAVIKRRVEAGEAFDVVIPGP